MCLCFHAYPSTLLPSRRCCPSKIRELLSFYKFDGDEIPLVMGSALAAVEGRDKDIGEDAIVELMQAVDDHIPTPTRG